MTGHLGGQALERSGGKGMVFGADKWVMCTARIRRQLRRRQPVCLRSRALLQVPVMDKVGQLRQTGTPIAGQEYWMVFSNKGNLVKPGDRVNVIIGSFRAEGLMVE